MDWEEIRYSELWPPDRSFSSGDYDSSTRHQALARVLLSIPDGDLVVLKKRLKQYNWFIPPPETRGAVEPAHAKRIIYLSPILEGASIDVVVAIVAHELAHIFLGHSLHNKPEEYKRQEQDANDLVVRWGFESEARKHHAVNLRREARAAHSIGRAP